MEKTNILYMSDETEKKLKEYVDLRNEIGFENDREAVFISTAGRYKGTRLSPRSIQLVVKKYLQAGISTRTRELSPQNLRATSMDAQ